MRTTLTIELPIYDLIAEIDADYWREFPDDRVHDISLCFLWAAGVDNDGKPCQVDLLKGLDRPSRLIVERNLFGSSPDFIKKLCDDFETIGDDLFIEPDYDPHTKDD